MDEPEPADVDEEAETPPTEPVEEAEAEEVAEEVAEAGEGEEVSSSSSQRYRTQRRGGKGVRDIKTNNRNGPVVAAVAVHDDDEILMITIHGKLQRIAVSDISVVGRNTQGVRIMTLDEEDALTAVVRVPQDENAAEVAEGEGEPADSQE